MAAVLLVPLLPLLALAIVVGLRAPMWLLAIYAALVPLGSGYALPLGLPDSLSTLSTLAGLLASVGIVAHLLGTRRRSPELLPAVGLFLLFLAVATATVLWSVDPARSVDQLVTLASLVLLFVVASFVAPDEPGVDRFEQAIVVGGVAAGLLAAFQLATGSLSTNAAGAPRFALAGGGGETSDPNITAAILLLPLVVAISRGLRATVTRRGRRVWLASAVLIGLAVLLTASRGGLLAAVVALLILVRVHRTGTRALALTGVALAIAVAVVAFGPGTLGERLTGEAGSTGRTMIWLIGVVACREHCLTWAGWGTFAELHEEILLQEPFATGREFRFEPHNAWLGTAVEGGIAALALLAGGIASLAGSLRDARRDRRTAALTALGALVVTNMFLSNQDFKYFWLVLLYAAVSATAGRDGHVVPCPLVREDAPPPRPPPRTLERVP